MKTTKFFASLGVVPGYGHDNATDASAVDIAGNAWQAAAAGVFAEQKVYVGAIITPARTVYHKDWGCPVGGELTVLITGERNPQYTAEENFKTAVVETLKRTAQALKQSTTQVTFQEVDMEYLDFREKKPE
ncbi:MAG: hypothetical protein WC456_00250 [Patescibacteria group bacterium]